MDLVSFGVAVLGVRAGKGAGGDGVLRPSALEQDVRDGAQLAQLLGGQGGRGGRGAGAGDVHAHPTRGREGVACHRAAAAVRTAVSQPWSPRTSPVRADAPSSAPPPVGLPW